MPEKRPADRAALERLCALFGVGTEYRDVWGARREVPETSLRALLAELGAEASTPERAAAAEREAEAARWRAAIAPFTAITAEISPWSVRVQLREAQAVSKLAWRIEEEGGASHEGAADAGALRELERTEVGGVPFVARELSIPVALPMGYHRFVLRDPARARGLLGETVLAATPARCYRPPALEDAVRVWGPAAQLYALRSERSWGIGDFGDLLQLIEQWSARGAGVIGLNPLHALFPHDPARASPYSPSSRLALNVLYVDVEAVEEFRECEEAREHVRSPGFRERLARLREASLVDYPGVAQAKFEVLERLYAHFRERHIRRRTQRALAFRDFQGRGGEQLRRHALYEALQERFHAADPPAWGWPAWPEEFRDPGSGAVARFCAERIERVEYFEYLQWQAEQQLARAAARCESAGLALGLYLDLAVSVDRAGSDAWANQDCHAPGASIGAPPDAYNLNGQGWGLPPLAPAPLRERGYDLFARTLREAMRHAGALRIDHVMGLMRLYWIPPGASAREGAYVHYALEELLAIVALESHRNRCLVVGEDLGTVPDEVRAALARAGVLSTRLLYFERAANGEFRPPQDYPRDALAAVSTHDLPTLAGWWSGTDLEWREKLALFPGEDERKAQLAARAEDRVRLARALERAGMLTPGEPPAPEALAAAVHAWLARAPALVMTVQLEDALAISEQANLPGTVLEHPNWRRKLPCTLERMERDPRLEALAAALARERPHPPRVLRGRRRGAARVPRATYRLQLQREFTFDAAARLAPYLARLGVSHVYCSPILRARPGSRHGYDIVAHGEINPELGGREGFERLAAALRAHGIGIVLDMVPNHMGVLGTDNAWWMDVLESGPASPYAQYFDIDWAPLNAELQDKVLLAVLGDHYGEVLARDEIALAFDPAAGGFAVRYFEHRFPLDPRAYPEFLRRAEEALAPGAASPEARDELANLAAAFARLPPRDGDAAARAERARDKDALKRRLAALAAGSAAVARAIAEAVVRFNAAEGDPGREALHALLEAQAYRLAYWLVASDEINYRRFFDINELAALRMENEAVFEATHGLTLDLAAAGLADGLRIDHPDGLYDPEQYFERLQQGYARRAGIPRPAPAPGGRPARPLYVIAEKITARHERVPESWAVHGTTGYRFAAVVNGVFVDPAARGRIERIWRGFTGESYDFEEAAYRGKRAIMRGALAAELTVLATELLRIARADRRTRDYTLNTLRQALAEVAACLPVYRTYVARKASAQDRRYVEWAVAKAVRRSRAADTSIYGFVRETLLGRALAGAPPELAERVLVFAMKFQQFSAPVTAKGVEDTAFYNYNPLASLNEVGSDPGTFGLSVAAFHGASADRAARWPHTMLATSTHDTKRSEDVRQRINVLSEMPAAWRLLLRRWRTLNRSRRTSVHGEAAPSANDEYLLYQTLLGTFPAQGAEGEALAAYRERIERYMLKAAREARVHTGWISPNAEYEAALAAFVRALLDPQQPGPFLEDLRAQAATVAWFGALNSLSMALLKYTSPGVPDLYQGSEILDFRLVDPDNRGTVDHGLRERLLDEIAAIAARPGLPAAARALAEAPHDGRAKLFVIWRLLELRRRMPELFRDGGYQPLRASGARAAHVLGYARRHGRDTLVVVAGRLFARLMGEPGRLPLGEAVWGDTVLEAGALAEGQRLANVLTGETIEVSQGRIALARAFASFPAAALLAGPAGGAAP